MKPLLPVLLGIGLAPLSFAYGIVTAGRNFLYNVGIFTAFRSSLPVISIGNITAGGNGKTPLAIKLSEGLREYGLKPVILSRGYGGIEKGPTVVIPSDSAKWVGDEPKLLATRGCVVVVAKDKRRGLKFIEARGLGDLVILDDGFQSRYLKRNLDLVCIEASQDKSLRDLSSGRLLPWGRLREFLGEVSKRADALVINMGAGGKEDLLRSEKIKDLFSPKLKSFTAKVTNKGIVRMATREPLVGADVALLSSIASPEKVIGTLSALGLNVNQTFFFRDHHLFDKGEINHILSSTDLPIVCTEKDAVKLIELSLPKMGSIFVSEIDLELSPDLVGFIKTSLELHKNL